MLTRVPVRRVRLGPPRRGTEPDEEYLVWIRTHFHTLGSRRHTSGFAGSGRSAPTGRRYRYASSITRAGVDIVAAAVEYARSKGLMVAPEFGDIRALAATICINETNGRRAA